MLHRLILLPLLALSALGVSACDAVNSASDTLGKAEVCTKAFQAAGFTPDLSNPEQTVKDAQQHAQELRDLSNKTTDAEVKRQLDAMANQLGQLGPEDLNPSGVTAWAQQKLNTYNQLQAACTSTG